MSKEVFSQEEVRVDNLPHFDDDSKEGERFEFRCPSSKLLLEMDVKIRLKWRHEGHEDDSAGGQRCDIKVIFGIDDPDTSSQVDIGRSCDKAYNINTFSASIGNSGRGSVPMSELAGDWIEEDFSLRVVGNSGSVQILVKRPGGSFIHLMESEIPSIGRQHALILSGRQAHSLGSHMVVTNIVAKSGSGVVEDDVPILPKQNETKRVNKGYETIFGEDPQDNAMRGYPTEELSQTNWIMVTAVIIFMMIAGAPFIFICFLGMFTVPVFLVMSPCLLILVFILCICCCVSCCEGDKQ